MNHYLEAWRKYAQFSGRSSRSEYWYFVLFNALASAASGLADAILGSTGVIIVLYAFASLIPSFAIFFRRLHDTGRSGWWWLIGIVPVIGGITLFIFMVLDSQPGDNRYGPNPKGVAAPMAPTASAV